MRKTFAAAAAVLLFAVAPLLGQGKRRVAVLDFNYGTVTSSVTAIFGGNQDIGKGITDLLIDKLVNDGTYRVIERQAMSKITSEQDFSNSGRADPSTAAKVGKLLGVDVIIIGDITQFGRDDKNTNIGGGGYGLGRFGVGGVGVHKAKATVAITARMVDVNTGEILASVTGTGDSKRNGTSLLGGGGGWSGGGNGSLDMGSSNFADTIIGEATKAAVENVGAALEAKSSALPEAAAPAAVVVSGLVADVAGSALVLNVGSGQGVKVGDTLSVVRADRVIKDPSTGQVLKTMTTPVGTVKIVSVDAASSEGTFTGAAAAKVGDMVKSQ